MVQTWWLMKLALAIFFASMALSVHGQVGQTQGPFMNQRSGVMAPNPLDGMGAVPARTVVLPKDPLRKIGGRVWNLQGEDVTNGWVSFRGKVLEVQPTGIRVNGEYTGYGWGDSEFFVKNFPYEVAENEQVGYQNFYVAKEAGVYTYPTAVGGSRTIRQLDYGTVYVPPPPTPEQIEAARAAAAKAKEKADAAKKAAQAKALKFNQDAAARGDAYGLLRMGERYRDGDGVPKDLAKARDYLSKAVAAGSPSAVDELSELDQSTNAPAKP